MPEEKPIKVATVFYDSSQGAYEKAIQQVTHLLNAAKASEILYAHLWREPSGGPPRIKTRILIFYR